MVANEFSKPKDTVNLKEGIEFHYFCCVCVFSRFFICIGAVTKPYLRRIVGPWYLWEKSVTWSFILCVCFGTFTTKTKKTE